MRGMRFSLVATITISGLVSCFPLAGVGSQEPSPTKNNPVFEVNMRQFGYENAQQHWSMLLDFTDAERVAVGWITFDRQNESHRAPLSSNPAHLHVVVLNTKNGQKQNQKDWPTQGWGQFFGVSGGNLLTCSGSNVNLFSPDIELLQRKELPGLEQCLHVSPSRRTLLVSIHSGHSYQMALFKFDDHPTSLTIPKDGL